MLIRAWNLPALALALAWAWAAGARLLAVAGRRPRVAGDGAPPVARTSLRILGLLVLPFFSVVAPLRGAADTAPAVAAPTRCARGGSPHAPPPRFEAVTGVTPEAGRSLPVPWFDIDAAVTLHDGSLRLTQRLWGHGRLSPTLTYRSQVKRESVLGSGWTASWESSIRRVKPLGNAAATTWDLLLRGRDGREDLFVWDEAKKTWRVPAGMDLRLLSTAPEFPAF